MKTAANVAVLGLVLSSVVQAAELSVVLTTDVLVSNVIPAGVNINNTTYDAPARKMRWEENFEGVEYRQIHPGTLYSNGFASIYGSTNQFEIKGWNALYPGAVYRIVSDAEPVRTGMVVRVEPQYVNTSGTNFQWVPFFTLDRDFPEIGAGSVSGVGLMVEQLDRVGQGYLGARSNYWISGNCDLATNSPAPGTFGTTSLKMDGTLAVSTYRTATFPSRLGDLDAGTWTVSFWCKTLSGAPAMSVASRYSGTQPVGVSSSWTKVQQVWTVASHGDTADREEFVLTASGGIVLIDDVEVWQNSETNGTAYRNDLVNTLKDYRAGLIRELQMGGGSLSNMLYSPLHQNRYAYSQYAEVGPYGDAERSPYGIHEFLQLCETVGAEPWLNLPGVLHTNETAQFMEYLAGPTNSGWGKIRADLGHPEPWTETLTAVNIEFGNEAWNLDWSFLFGGFNGANYWRSLIGAAKSSPYYTANIVFHAAGQNFDSAMASRILGDVTNADSYAIAPYALSSLTTNDLAVQDTDQKLFNWMLNYPLYDIYTRMSVHSALINNGMEYSMYEFNYHTTSGDAPADVRNRFLTSRAAGLSVANASLLYLQQYGIRRQCLFALTQEYYGSIALWGMNLSYKNGSERARPNWLANVAVNQVRRGNMVATVLSSNVTQTLYGRFNSSSGAAPVTNIYPAVFSYGFRDGTTNGLVLVNYDLTATQNIHVIFGEQASYDEAQSWLLDSASYTNNNEWSSPSLQVSLVQATLTNFVSGSAVAVPPGTLRVLKWKSAGPGEDWRAPVILNLDPGSGVTNQEPAASLQMIFSESVYGYDGTIKVCTVSNGTVVCALPADSSNIQINGLTVVVDLPADLGFSTDYYVLIETNAFADAAGNFFAGISSNGTWRFRTRDQIALSTNTLRIDFGLTNAPVESDGNWQDFGISDAATSKATGRTYLLGSSNITVTVNGPNMSGRDRANPSADSGARTYSSMCRDLIQAAGTLTVQISGLRSGEAIQLRAWMYDYQYSAANVLSLVDVTGGGSALIGSVTNVTGSGGLPTDNIMYSAGGEVYADSDGTVVLNCIGSLGSSRLNGLEIIQVTGDIPPVYKSLTVSSDQGMAVPESGTNLYLSGSYVTCSVTNSSFESGGYHYLCTGWTGAGSVPDSGSGTSISFILRYNSSIVWLWQTNLLLEVAETPNGRVSGAGWYAVGLSATVTAVAARGYLFAGWRGDVPAGQVNDNPLVLAMDQPKQLAAHFEPVMPISAVNRPIVDFGAKLGSGYYRGQNAPRSYTALTDQDQNGTLTNDTVRAWIFSLSEPLHAPALEFDVNTVNGVFYGGLTLFAVNNPARTLTEGLVNQNHEFYDDLNMMGLGDIIEGEQFRSCGVWLWQKQDFLNGADDYAVHFDENSAISVHISRYWGGVNAGRWLVRDGGQFYLSQATFAGRTNQYDMTTTDRAGDPGDGANNPVVRTTHTLLPLTTLWAPYNPGGGPGSNDDFEISFDADTAAFASHSFSNITAVGFFVQRNLSVPVPISSALLANQPMGVKWNAFRCKAVVERPDDPSFYQPTTNLASGACSIGTGAVSYGLWRRVFRSAQRRSCMSDLPARTYSFENDGSMGTMRVDDLAHTQSEPVTDISWLDALAFCNGLSEMEGLEPCYYSDAAMTNILRIVVNRDLVAGWNDRPSVYWKTNAAGFRLPTAREWEQTPAGIHATNLWEYVWHPAGTFAAADQPRTARSWGLVAPTSSLSHFNERPWQRSPRIGFRIVRNGVAGPDMSAPSGGSSVWTFSTDTVLAPVSALSSAEVRALILPLCALVPLDVSLIAGVASADTGFIPSATLTNTPQSIGVGATEVPYKLWNLVQQWGRDHGYGFNYAGDMGSMGNAPGETVHTGMEPVTEISVYDTYAWCNALSELMGRTPVYYLDAALTQVYRQANLFRLETLQREGSPHWPDGSLQPYDTAALIPVYMNAQANGYRIPLPQEWKLADTTDANSAADAYNWLLNNSGGKTQPVGTKLPNPVGLYDMEGNVLELTWGSGKATIDNAPWRMGSHFARASQIGKNPWQSAEFVGVGRAHVGFRILGATGSYGLQLSTTNITVGEGGSSDFTVSLSAAPGNNVSVTVSRVSGDGDLSVVSGETLLFTPADWFVSQNVTVRAAEDSDALNGTAVFRVAADGSYLDVAATEADNDSDFSITPSSLDFFWTEASGSVTAELFNATFEESTNLPSGWSQQWVDGVTTPCWKIQQGGYTGGLNPSAAHTGSNNACLYYAGHSNVTVLISPAVNMGAASSAVLSFWHTQEYWSPDQDTLRIQYRTNNSAWITLATYTNDIPAWASHSLSIPVSTNLQLGFEGTAVWGYGVCLDDIALKTVSPGGGMPPPQSLTISNSGQSAVSLSNIWNAAWLNLSPIGVQLAPGQSAAITAGIVSNTLEIGTSTATVWVADGALQVPVVVTLSVSSNLPSCQLTLSSSEIQWGTVQPESGLYLAGTPVTLQATPATYGVFTGWSGDASGISNPEQISMNSAKTVTALFSEKLFTNGTPAGWLAEYGIEASDDGALSDTDGDGLAAWEEYIAGTLPNLGASVFRVSTRWENPQGYVLEWQAVSGRVYSVYWSSNLPSGVWSMLSTGASGSYTDSLHGVGFYRIRVQPE